MILLTGEFPFKPGLLLQLKQPLICKKKDEDISAQHGKRGGRGVSEWTEEGGGGNVPVDGCGNDRVTAEITCW